jgi:Steigviridae/Suoliviridae L,D-carboxypeptidase/transpeptidase
MKLLLKRFEKSRNGKATIGLLFVDGKFFCYTLEDVVRPEGAPKVYGETAIPEGTYPVNLRYSEHFKRIMPHVDNVPNFSGILLHWGNKDKDTDGCVLVGLQHTTGEDFIGSSLIAFNALFNTLRNGADANEKTTVEVVNAFGGE